MKKFENPMISISMFDASVATGDSAQTQAINAITGNDTVDVKSIGRVNWNDASDWTF